MTWTFTYLKNKTLREILISSMVLELVKKLPCNQNRYWKFEEMKPKILVTVRFAIKRKRFREFEVLGSTIVKKG